MALAPLPIDPSLGLIVETLRSKGVAVLSAPPGAGKTTRVPRALLDAGLAGEIVVLEPRRIAARVSAARVAEELGERVGSTVGFQTRFERAISRETRIRFVTEGILARRLTGDPELRGTSAVLLDEFHERHLQTDVALGHLAELRRTARPDLLVMPMSATLDAGPVAAFLGATEIEVPGRSFPVEVEHLAKTDDRPLGLQVASASRRALAESDGHILVFLPGAREIRAASEACARIARDAGADILSLHGSLSAGEQDRAVRPSERRKLILATNVAETSITIDGVTSVIDSGLAFSASLSPWSGLPSLRLSKVSKAACAQRAGRAGRTRPGRCLRLFTSSDFAARPAFETPEIQRLDLAETVLELIASGHGDPSGFAWFEPPDARRLESAIRLLRMLGATSGAPPRLELTPIGRRMVRLPLHPRQGRMVAEAEARGVARDGAVLAALVAERELRSGPSEPYRGPALRSDLLRALDDFDDARGASRDRLRSSGVDASRVDRVRRVAADLTASLDESAPRPPDAEAYERALLRTIFAGYPDRVGRLRRPESATGRAGLEIVLAGGGTAALAETSAVIAADLVVAVDAEERTTGARAHVVVRAASSIELDDVLEMATEDIADETELVLVEPSGRVEEVRRLKLGALVLEETRAPARDGEAVSRLLAKTLASRGLPDATREAVGRLGARIAFVRRIAPATDLPAIESLTERAIEHACAGRSSLREIGEIDLAEKILDELAPPHRRSLRELAPDRVELPSGRSVPVHYPPDAAPSIESRLQDFFGLADGPRVGGGKIPLVLHLLAPNQRAVQVTTDLDGFWLRHYPALAKELRRRYPKHSFPDDPLHAAPPPARRR